MDYYYYYYYYLSRSRKHAAHSNPMKEGRKEERKGGKQEAPRERP